MCKRSVCHVVVCIGSIYRKKDSEIKKKKNTIFKLKNFKCQAKINRFIIRQKFTWNRAKYENLESNIVKFKIVTVNVILNCGFFSGDVLLFFNYIPFFRTHAPLLDQGHFNLLMNRISIKLHQENLAISKSAILEHHIMNPNIKFKHTIRDTILTVLCDGTFIY